MGSLGKAIREERKEQRLTLKQLAERSGFSHSYISQVERDLIVPSLSALIQLAGALGVSPGSLVDAFNGSGTEEGRPSVQVVRRDQRLTVIYPGSSAKNELLLPQYDPDFSIAWLAFPPRSTNTPMGDRKRGSYQHCVVVSGRLRFVCGSEDIELERGDAVAFDPCEDHLWINEESEATEVVLFTRSGV